MPSLAIAGREPIRTEFYNSAVYAHDGHECLLWDLACDGKLFLECNCGLTAVELAEALGIDRSRLADYEINSSARTVAERLLAVEPNDHTALAMLALIGT